jgi:DNA repair photolyase
MELRDYREFEQKIFAKQWNAYAFAAELRKIPTGEAICLGTATDPYQPAERRYRITRQMLEVFARARGNRLWVTTKSDLVARDADLLVEIGRANVVQVNMTVTTTDEKLARIVEPKAPRPALRFAAVRKLSEAGVRVGVLAHPVMPLINDSLQSLDAIGAQAAASGASFISAAVLFLKPCAQAAFFPFLQEHFPHLVRKYRERYERNAYLNGHYPDLIKQRLEQVRVKNGLDLREKEELPDLWPYSQQLTLFE